jgi:hypothetical protein
MRRASVSSTTGIVIAVHNAIAQMTFPAPSACFASIATTMALRRKRRPGYPVASLLDTDRKSCRLRTQSTPLSAVPGKSGPRFRTFPGFRIGSIDRNPCASEDSARGPLLGGAIPHGTAWRVWPHFDWHAHPKEPQPADVGRPKGRRNWRSWNGLDPNLRRYRSCPASPFWSSFGRIIATIHGHRGGCWCASERSSKVAGLR